MSVSAVARPILEHRRRKYRLREVLTGYGFLSFSLFGMLVYSLIPVLFGLYVSFTKYSGIGAPKWSGLHNYLVVLTDPFFWSSIVVTAAYTLITVPAVIALSLVVAVLLNRALPFRNVVRTSFYIPSVVPWVAAVLLFQNMFDYKFGLINQALAWLGIQPFNWLGGLDTGIQNPIFIVVIVISLWKGFGFTMLILLAALQDVPPQLHDAAKVDGANRVQRFFSVTLPSISPMILFVFIISVIGQIQSFTPFYLLGGGGTITQGIKVETIVTYAYMSAFQSFQYGYGAAILWVLFVIMFVFTYGQLRMSTSGTGHEREF